MGQNRYTVSYHQQIHLKYDQTCYTISCLSELRRVTKSCMRMKRKGTRGQNSDLRESCLCCICLVVGLLYYLLHCLVVFSVVSFVVCVALFSCVLRCIMCCVLRCIICCTCLVVCLFVLCIC